MHAQQHQVLGSVPHMTYQPPMLMSSQPRSKRSTTRLRYPPSIGPAATRGSSLGVSTFGFMYMW